MIIPILIVFLFLLINPETSSHIVLDTAKLWMNKLVPILYPNFIIVDFLIANRHIGLLSQILYKPLRRIFNINYPKSSMILLLSIICGAPASTKLIKNALDNNDIDINEANALIYTSSCFSLPYSIYILNSFNISIGIYLIAYIISIILLMHLANKKNTNNIPLKATYNQSYLKILFSSINKNIDILLSILGLMIFFNIVLTSYKIDHILYSYFEVLNGHSFLLALDINKKLKDLILISSLSFLGFSIHLQILYVYPDLKYFKFIFYKILQSLFITFIFLSLILF